MERLAFKMYLNEGQKSEYKKRNDELWPELNQLHLSGRRNQYTVCFSESERRRRFAGSGTNRNRSEMVGIYVRHHEM
jgi:L-rhamnose mutarotase